VSPRSIVHVPPRSVTEGTDYQEEDRGDEPFATGRGDEPVGTGPSDDPIATGRGDEPVGTGRSDEPFATGRGDEPVGTGRGEEPIGPGRGDEPGGGPVGRAEDRLMEIARDAEEAEDRRESHFRHNEDERDRIFLDNEAKRDQDANQRRDDIYQELRDRLEGSIAGIHPPDTLPPTRPTSIHESMHTAAQDAASRHADDIMETVRLEREELAREREAAAADRERLRAEQDAARVRAEEECQAKISALEEELARVREELENERQQRITEEAETRERERMEALERDEAVRNQLGDITNLVQDQREECARKKELMDERWAEKQTRREHKDSKMQDLFDMVAKIVEDREVDKIKAEEARLANEGKPGESHIIYSCGHSPISLQTLRSF
jgi:hypothetical protein